MTLLSYAPSHVSHQPSNSVSDFIAVSPATKDSKQKTKNIFRDKLCKLSPNTAAELLRYGRSCEDIISLAQGEGDNPTPDFIQQGAIKALQDGKTFYGPVLGFPELRQEISNYYARIFNLTLPTNRIFVTSSGTTAVHLALHSILDDEDEVIALTPIWKNLIGIMEMANARIKEVAMQEHETGWQLDVNQLIDAVTPKTKAILIVTPSNPTGWMMKKEDMEHILDFARERNIWIISDEIYARTVYGQKRAPSFLDIALPEDKLFTINSFSKSWSMTGWRLGWLVGPAEAEDKIRDLALYENMGPTSFTQFAGISALRHGEHYIQEQMDIWQSNLDLILDYTAQSSRIQFTRPPATFYAFFRVDGMSDSYQFCRELIDHARVSLAPGCSFGSKCGDYIRLCFACSPQKLEQAMDRLGQFLTR
jgi:aspartate aminotransferase